MKFSIIVPSFNQEHYIQQTLKNIVELKKQASAKGITIELLVFDSESNAQVQTILDQYRNTLDYLEVKKDQGQYDAINKGIVKCTGDYWTWLNTDDLLDVDGFFKVAAVLQQNPDIDYIYGSVTYIDERENVMKTVNAWNLTTESLVKQEPAIFQPGSWFKKEFTDQVGLLAPYACCFDYEYILRLLKYKAHFYKCDFPVSKFRYHAASKTGSNTVQFIREQRTISSLYGRKWYNYLSFFSKLRLVKHFLFPRA
jgi:glycosyltransferase involved in cell wall biosynthesis